MNNNITDDLELLVSAFPKWQRADISRTLLRIPPENRVRNAMAKYIRSFDANVDRHTCEMDAGTVHRLFPEVPLKTIFGKLAVLGHEKNRIRIVIRMLLHEADSRKSSQTDTIESQEIRKMTREHDNMIDDVNSSLIAMRNLQAIYGSVESDKKSTIKENGSKESGGSSSTSSTSDTIYNNSIDSRSAETTSNGRIVSLDSENILSENKDDAESCRKSPPKKCILSPSPEPFNSENHSDDLTHFNSDCDSLDNFTSEDEEHKPAKRSSIDLEQIEDFFNNSEIDFSQDLVPQNLDIVKNIRADQIDLTVLSSNEPSSSTATKHTGLNKNKFNHKKSKNESRFYTDTSDVGKSNHTKKFNLRVKCTDEINAPAIDNTHVPQIESETGDLRFNIFEPISPLNRKRILTIPERKTVDLTAEANTEANEGTTGIIPKKRLRGNPFEILSESPEQLISPSTDNSEANWPIILEADEDLVNEIEVEYRKVEDPRLTIFPGTSKQALEEDVTTKRKPRWDQSGFGKKFKNMDAVVDLSDSITYDFGIRAMDFNTQNDDERYNKFIEGIQGEKEPVVSLAGSAELMRELSEEISSLSTKEEFVIDDKLYHPLMEIFPEACPTFLKGLCNGKTNTPGELDRLISEVLDVDYPRRTKELGLPEEINVDDQLEILMQVLPDADPTYLRKEIENCDGDPEIVKAFINEAMETRAYPTLKEYQRKQQLSTQAKQYTTDFDVDKFLEQVPDPVAYYKSKKPEPISHEERDYLLMVLRNKFNMLTLRIIGQYLSDFTSVTGLFMQIEAYSTKAENCMKGRRRLIRFGTVLQNIPFLQEIAYNLNRDTIHERLAKLAEDRKAERAEARAAGLLQTCCCCYDDELLPHEALLCGDEGSCVSCRECVQRSTEVAFGEGKTDFPCVGGCGVDYTLRTLQDALSKKLFSKVAQKKQLAEVRAAGLEDLELCPFCDFATIPAAGDRLFRCYNPDCMKESCLECKQPNHIPLRCEEVEMDKDVKARVYIENKMTEALVRSCWKCEAKFIKSDGCNKMTCPKCGSFSCYVCGKAVKDYKHFNGQGGDKYNLCPLYSDTNKLHAEAVLKVAEEAKKDVDLTALKNDPTKDIKNYYEDFNKKNPVVLPPGVQLQDPQRGGLVAVAVGARLGDMLDLAFGGPVGYHVPMGGAVGRPPPVGGAVGLPPAAPMGGAVGRPPPPPLGAMARRPDAPPIAQLTHHHRHARMAIREEQAVAGRVRLLADEAVGELGGPQQQQQQQQHNHRQHHQQRVHNHHHHHHQQQQQQQQQRRPHPAPHRPAPPPHRQYALPPAVRQAWGAPPRNVQQGGPFQDRMQQLYVQTARAAAREAQLVRDQFHQIRNDIRNERAAPDRHHNPLVRGPPDYRDYRPQ